MNKSMCKWYEAHKYHVRFKEQQKVQQKTK